MPHVEVLPNSSASLAPGWHYVVDTGYDPSKVAINPKNKKRAAANPNQRGEHELSSRQQTAIARRIAELNRDNDPKQSIPVPLKSSAVPKTQNARRIIQYQRQIKHWLDDEEAQLALVQQAPQPRSATAASRLAAQLPRRSSTMPSVPATPSESATPAPAAATPSKPLMPHIENDDDPLLDVDNLMPPPISSAELDALLSAPPLSFAASHVAPPPRSRPPPRHFCDNCGYWGKIKCLKCGTRVCGMECKDAHEATRCLKWA